MEKEEQDVSSRFVRNMGCSAEELLRWLPVSFPGATLKVGRNLSSGWCKAVYPDGVLGLQWRVLEPRQIALLRIPQLEVEFAYTDLSPERRREVQEFFDRTTHRGGG